MSDQTSIFNQSTPVENTNTQQVNPNTNLTDLLSSIKNERGEQKYSSVEAALEGLRNAQEFIPTLKTELNTKEQELQRLRAESERIRALEASIEDLANQRQSQQTNTQPVFDEDRIAEVISRTLTRKEQEAVQSQNIASVVSTLQSVYNQDAEKRFYDKAQELGMTVPEMNALAARSPKAVLTMLGITQQSAPKQNTQSPVASTVNSSAFQQTQETYVGRNPKPIMVGATTSDIIEASRRAKAMAEELSSQGKSVWDLSDPKVYAKMFK